MTANPAPLHIDQVSVTDTAVHVATFTETNADVVRFVAGADDPAEAVHNCLRVGATALRVANTAVDVDLVQRQFDGLNERFGTHIDGAVEQINAATSQLLDAEDGALTTALSDFHQGMEEMLGATFDPDSKASVLSKIETLVAEVVRGAVDGVRRLVDPNGDDSPLARMRSDIVAEVKEEIVGVVRTINDLSTGLGIANAVAAEHERTSAKGFDFEDVVDDAIARCAATHGDLHESVGQERGSTGSKVGDEVVTLNADDTRGTAARFVLEVKARKLSARKIIEELDEAMKNRDALAAIAVFNDQANAPSSTPFHYCDDKAFVVLDADGDEGALQLAYMWARWVVRRKVSGGLGDAIDHERIAALLADARRALERHITIKRSHSTAIKSIEQAQTETASLADEVRTALTELARELGDGR